MKILKIGGSILTDKTNESLVDAARHSEIKRVAEEVAAHP